MSRHNELRLMLLQFGWWGGGGGWEACGCMFLLQSAHSVRVGVCVWEGCGGEVAKSGLKGGLQSSTPRLRVAFDVGRCLWWPQPWRNAAHPPSPITKPPELWNAAQAAAGPAGMGLECGQHSSTLPPHRPPPPSSHRPLEWTTWQPPRSDSKLWDYSSQRKRIYIQCSLFAFSLLCCNQTLSHPEDIPTTSWGSFSFDFFHFGNTALTIKQQPLFRNDWLLKNWKAHANRPPKTHSDPFKHPVLSNW